MMRTLVKREEQETAEGFRVSISFDEAGLQLTPTPFGIVVRLEGCVTAGEPGSPGLPTRVVRVALPPFTRATDAEGQALKSILVTDKDAVIAPVQPPRPATKAVTPREAIDPRFLSRTTSDISRAVLRKPDKPFVEPYPTPPFVPPRLDVYEREGKKPRPVARFLRTETVGAVPMAVIEINPVRLTSAYQLEFHPEIEVFVHCTTVDLKRRADLEKGRRVQIVDKAIRSQGQARRATALASRMVVNPEMVANLVEIVAAEPAVVDYLIVTDNQTWDAVAIRATGSVGDLVTPFQRLADWKARRGLSTRVVTVSDIVGGAYGDFCRDARDLQEVIRSFLKWAHTAWGVSWVLLGGDVDILPVRRAAGAVLGHIWLQSTDPPPDNCAYWTGSFLKMNVVNPGDWWPGGREDHLLVHPDTGMLVAYDADGTSGPKQRGWYFTTDATCQVRSKVPTQFVRVNGPSEEVNATLQWLYEWNTLPTDLYYASLTGPGYNMPGLHDWDLIDNGVYGQHNWSRELDGVSYQVDVSVGRAPVSNPDQANAFASKVIAYEQFRGPDGTPLDMDWPRRMVLVSANFWGSIWIFPNTDFPPLPGTFYYDEKRNLTLIRLNETPYDLLWNLISFVTEGDVRLVPFDLGAATNGHGWYFAKSATDLSPSLEPIMPGVKKRPVPVPTEWVVVYAKPSELAPEHFVFDRASQDTSMEGKEAVRAQLASETPQIDRIYRLYEDEFDLTPEQANAAPVEHLSPKGLRAALDAAPHFVSLSGHGSSGGCCWLDSWTAQSLTNGYTTFIAYADSCFTNQFDTEDAVSEILVQNPKGGAVAYIGSTRFSWIGVGDDFEVVFFQRLPSTFNLGVLADSRCSLVNGSSGWGVYNNWVALSLNLVGDPEMPIWIGTPKALSISFDPSPREGAPFVVQVTEVLGLSLKMPVLSKPLAGARVHVQQGHFSASAVSGNDGLAKVSLKGAKAGAIEITVSLNGYIPVQAQAVVVAPTWVSGLVSAILHQHGAPDRSLIRLRLPQGAERNYDVRKSLPDYELIMSAAVAAYFHGKEIALCVDRPENGGIIERFRIGRWITPLTEIEDDMDPKRGDVPRGA